MNCHWWSVNLCSRGLAVSCLCSHVLLWHLRTGWIYPVYPMCSTVRPASSPGYSCCNSAAQLDAMHLPLPLVEKLSPHVGRMLLQIPQSPAAWMARRSQRQAHCGKHFPYRAPTVFVPQCWCKLALLRSAELHEVAVDLASRCLAIKKDHRPHHSFSEHALCSYPSSAVPVALLES